MIRLHTGRFHRKHLMSAYIYIIIFISGKFVQCVFVQMGFVRGVLTRGFVRRKGLSEREAFVRKGCGVAGGGGLSEGCCPVGFCKK